jgi:hypothetical protein
MAWASVRSEDGLSISEGEHAMNATGERDKRDRARTGRFAAVLARMRGRVSYGGVIASVALFVALGGTAAAVTALPRDSVGSPQIRTDAVRSPEIAADAVRAPEIAADAVRAPEIAADAVRAPEIAADAVRAPEIAADAVRSPEIADGAVRSSELRDGDIRLADISTGARNALQGAQGPAGPQGPAGMTELRVAENGARDLPHCTDQGLVDCPNLVARTLGAGNWLIQAKLDVANLDSQPVALGKCGLAQGSSVLDRTSFHLDPFVDFADVEDMALTAVLTDVANGTTVALRCSEQTGEDIFAEDVKLTAVKVTTVTGP